MHSVFTVNPAAAGQCSQWIQIKKSIFFVYWRTYQKDSIFSFHNVCSKPVAPPWSVNPVAPQCSHWTLSPLSIHIEPCRPSVFTVNHVAPQCLQWIISPLSVYSEPCRPQWLQWTMLPLSVHHEPGRPQCSQWAMSPLTVHREPCRFSAFTVNPVTVNPVDPHYSQWETKRQNLA